MLFRTGLILASIALTQMTAAFHAAAQTVAAPAPAADPYRDGLSALERGALGEAERLFTESLKADPNASGPLLGLADVALRRNRLADAEKHLRQALDANPNRADVHTAWARLLYVKRDYPGAVASLERAIALDGGAMAPRVDLGDVYLQGLRQPEKAAAAYREALRVSPGHIGARNALSVALTQMGKPAEARTELLEAVRLAPDNALTYVSLARVELALGRPDAAVAATEKALEISPRFVAAHVARGDALVAKNDLERALKAYTHALTIDANAKDAWAAIGMVHQSANSSDLAERAYKRALAIDPNQPVVLNNLAWMAAENRRELDSALVWAQRAVRLSPRVAAFHGTLGWVHRARGDLKAATGALESAASLGPQAETLYRLGVVYRESGQRTKAAAAFDRALELDPKHGAAATARRELAGN